MIQYPEEYITKLLEFFAFCEGGAAQEGAEIATEEGAEEPVQKEELDEQGQSHQNMEFENSSTGQK